VAVVAVLLTFTTRLVDLVAAVMLVLRQELLELQVSQTLVQAAVAAQVD
jgi:hypothetical protein